MNTLVLAFPGQEPLARQLATALGAEFGSLEIAKLRGEQGGMRIAQPVWGRVIIVLCELQPEASVAVSLYLTASSLRDSGAQRVFIFSARLPYSTKRNALTHGEIDSSRYYARLLSSCADGLITVASNPTEARSINEMFSMPVETISADSELPLPCEIATAVDSLLHRRAAGSASRYGALPVLTQINAHGRHPTSLEPPKPEARPCMSSPITH